MITAENKHASRPQNVWFINVLVSVNYIASSTKVGLEVVLIRSLRNASGSLGNMVFPVQPISVL